jgi:hypothetical protein
MDQVPRPHSGHSGCIVHHERMRMVSASPISNLFYLRLDVQAIQCARDQLGEQQLDHLVNSVLIARSGQS